MKLNKEERKILINVLEERLELAESFEENLVKKVVFHGIGIIGGIEMVLNDSFKPMQDLLKKLQGAK
jgi:hypothetical protein